MGNAAILEVAIGMIFVFSLLSILVTQINTLIINFLNLKAKRLKEQLDKVLSDPVIRAKIMTHPLIRMVETGQEVVMTNPTETLTEQQALSLTDGKKARVGYVESERFVSVLVDVLTAKTGEKLYEELNKTVEKMAPSVEKSLFREVLRQIQLSGTGLSQLRDMIDKLSDPETKRSMLQALNLVDAALDKLKVENSDLIPLLLGIRQIKDRYLQTALEAVVNTATSIKDAQIKLGQWFDGTMQRATEYYIREMQRFSLGIGLLLALVLNVDALHLARTLWEDPALRASVAATAAVTRADVESEANQANQEETEATQGQGDLATSLADAQQTLRRLLDLRLPVGWTVQDMNDPAYAGLSELEQGRAEARNLWMLAPGNNPNWFGWMLQKIIGIVITTIAVAQGAPFWFDLLRKLTRGGG